MAKKVKYRVGGGCVTCMTCMYQCPMQAISFEEREAPAYNESAVLAAKKAKEQPQPCGCPGSACRSLPARQPAAVHMPSCLTNFPVQIKLVPVNAPWFDGAELLIAADCTAFACGNFHREFMPGKVTLIGCPKLDAVNYAEKLSQIFAYNDIRSVTVVRMTVPCCGGLTFAVKTALEQSGKQIPMQVYVVTPDGKVMAQ